MAPTQNPRNVPAPQRAVEEPSPAPSSSALPTPAPGMTLPPGATTPVALPSLAPGESITWTRVDRPRLDLLGIFVSSFWIVLAAAVASIAIGVALGAIRSRRGAADRLTRIDLRSPDA